MSRGLPAGLDIKAESAKLMDHLKGSLSVSLYNGQRDSLIAHSSVLIYLFS